MESSQIRITTNYKQETSQIINEIERFLESFENQSPSTLDIQKAQANSLLAEAKRLKEYLMHMQRYTLDIPNHLSKPGSIIVYHEIIDPFLQAKGPNKLVELADLSNSPFTLPESDIIVDISPKFLFLEVGQNFYINNRTTAICRSVLSKEDVIKVISDSDPEKESFNIDEEDRIVIEAKEGYRYLVAGEESPLIGKKIGGEASYHNQKVKIIGSITKPTFEKRILP